MANFFSLSKYFSKSCINIQSRYLKIYLYLNIHFEKKLFDREGSPPDYGAGVQAKSLQKFDRLYQFTLTHTQR